MRKGSKGKINLMFVSSKHGIAVQNILTVKKKQAHRQLSLSLNYELLNISPMYLPPKFYFTGKTMERRRRRRRTRQPMPFLPESSNLTQKIEPTVKTRNNILFPLTPLSVYKINKTETDKPAASR